MSCRHGFVSFLQADTCLGCLLGTCEHGKLDCAECGSIISKREEKGVAGKAKTTFWGCEYCPGKKWPESGLLVAPNPFDSAQQIIGCPSCKSVEAIEELCDEPGCHELAGCGTPHATGYRRTCYRHIP